MYGLCNSLDNDGLILGYLCAVPLLKGHQYVLAVLFVWICLFVIAVRDTSTDSQSVQHD